MVDAPTRFEALERAVLLCGGQSAMARVCGMSQAAVWKWLQTSKRLPAEHVIPVETATGVSRHLLRPDIYPLEADMPVPVLPQATAPTSPSTPSSKAAA